MPKKKTQTTIAPEPPAPPPTDDEIRQAFVEKAREEIAAFDKAKQRFLEQFGENPTAAFHWRMEGVVAAQETAKLWYDAVETLGRDGTLRQDFDLILQWVEHELQDELRCHRWEHTNTNPIANSVRCFGVTARVRAYLDIKMRARLALHQIEQIATVFSSDGFREDCREKEVTN